MSLQATTKYATTNRSLVLGYLFPICPLNSPSNSHLKLPASVKEVLHSYFDLFEVLIGLPPSRSHDHHIQIKEGVTPVYSRPYRYPQIQKKNQIEKHIT